MEMSDGKNLVNLVSWL